MLNLHGIGKFPHISVNLPLVNFGEVYTGLHMTRHAILSNPSLVPANFQVSAYGKGLCIGKYRGVWGREKGMERKTRRTMLNDRDNDWKSESVCMGERDNPTSHRLADLWACLSVRLM
jgi:hypothetical protein